MVLVSRAAGQVSQTDRVHIRVVNAGSEFDLRRLKGILLGQHNVQLEQSILVDAALGALDGSVPMEDVLTARLRLAAGRETFFALQVLNRHDQRLNDFASKRGRKYTEFLVDSLDCRHRPIQPGRFPSSR